ncbi:MAG: hypothetical protein JRF43_00610 [Deltaproteobacteria bacterium]|nr:hypothetical protein [Deltaproteobacteria bacterium]
MLSKTRPIPEHHITVNDHLIRKFVDLLKQRENAWKLASVLNVNYFVRSETLGCCYDFLQCEQARPYMNHISSL